MYKLRLIKEMLSAVESIVGRPNIIAFAVDLREDGLIIATSLKQIELVDLQGFKYMHCCAIEFRDDRVSFILRLDW